MKMRNLISDTHASWYPVAVYIIIIFAAGLTYYLLNDTVTTFLGYTDSVMGTFFSVFWKATIVLIPIIAGVWMLVYMQRLRRFEYE